MRGRNKSFQSRTHAARVLGKRLGITGNSGGWLYRPGKSKPVCHGWEELGRIYGERGWVAWREGTTRWFITETGNRAEQRHVFRNIADLQEEGRIDCDDPHCKGWFVRSVRARCPLLRENCETGMVERCDTCEQFEDDLEAEAYAIWSGWQPAHTCPTCQRRHLGCWNADDPEQCAQCFRDNADL